MLPFLYFLPFHIFIVLLSFEFISGHEVQLTVPQGQGGVFSEEPYDGYRGYQIEIKISYELQNAYNYYT